MSDTYELDMLHIGSFSSLEGRIFFETTEETLHYLLSSILVPAAENTRFNAAW